MPIALTGPILAGALVLALAGGWGLYRLLGRLRLGSAERLVLTLALLPALLGLTAFGGLLAGRPGSLLPALVCAVLAVVGVALVTRTGRGPSGRAHGQNDGEHGPNGGGRGTNGGGRGTNGGGRGNPRPYTATVGAGIAPPAQVFTVAVAAGLYAAGTLGTTLLTPLSGGALRIGDWLAHWFLVVVYLGLPLPDLRVFTNRVGDFGVISRPPLYNLEGGLLVGALTAGSDAPFWPFQLLTPLLALPVVAAGVLWAHALGGPRAARVLAALAGLSPFLLQNASYPWSKMVAAGLVLLFLYLIRVAVLAWEPGRARRTFVLAAFCAGLGYLAHQTTIFYVLPTLLWLAWRRPRPLFRRPLAWLLTTWAFGGLAGLAAFGPWQGWVLATYGLQATLAANPASFGADVSETFGDWLLKGGVAAIGTLVPLPALTALVRGGLPTLDQLLRVQLALLTGAFGVSGCWVLIHAWGGRGKPAGHAAPLARKLAARLPWLPLVVLGGFLGQVMLQPNWHDTGDAAESMTPIVVLGLAVIAREALRLGSRARWLFGGLVLAELALYLGLWLTWAFGAAWTRDPNAVLASRYGLEHLRGAWPLAVPLGALLLGGGLAGSAALLWPALTVKPAASHEPASQSSAGRPAAGEVSS